MIKVNLGGGGEPRRKKLPKLMSKASGRQTSPKKTKNKPDIGGTILLAASLALSVLPHLFLNQYKESVRQKHEGDIQKLEEKRSYARAELTKYKSYKADLESFEKQKAELSQRLEALNRLLKIRSGPVNIIDTIGQSISENAWLNQLKLILQEKSSVTFSGSARTSESVTQFAEKLSKSIYLANVQLNEMVSAFEGKEEIKNFSFEADIKLK